MSGNVRTNKINYHLLFYLYLIISTHLLCTYNQQHGKIITAHTVHLSHIKFVFEQTTVKCEF